MTSKPKLYMIPYSEPVRAVLMAIKALNMDVDYEEVNLFERKQMSPEFLKINPQHSVPTVVDDDGFTIWDSHAIMPYLVDKYVKDDSLYPKDLKKRARVNQRLLFDCGTLFVRNMRAMRPTFYQGAKSIPQEYIDDIVDAYNLLEKILEMGGADDWVAGENVTIADFSVIASITTMDIIVPIDVEKFPRVNSWMVRVLALPCDEPELKGRDLIRNSIQEKLS